MHHKVAHGAWVFVGDGQKALFLINEGRRKISQSAPPGGRGSSSTSANRAATLQGAPIPASARFAAPLERRTGTLEKERFAAFRSRTGSIGFGAVRGFNELRPIAPPKILGDLRRKFTKETETKIIAEVPKDYSIIRSRRSNVC